MARRQPTLKTSVTKQQKFLDKLAKSKRQTLGNVVSVNFNGKEYNAFTDTYELYMLKDHRGFEVKNPKEINYPDVNRILNTCEFDGEESEYQITIPDYNRTCDYIKELKDNKQLTDGMALYKIKFIDLDDILAFDMKRLKEVYEILGCSSCEVYWCGNPLNPFILKNGEDFAVLCPVRCYTDEYNEEQITE